MRHETNQFVFSYSSCFLSSFFLFPFFFILFFLLYCFFFFFVFGVVRLFKLKKCDTMQYNFYNTNLKKINIYIIIKKNNLQHV